MDPIQPTGGTPIYQESKEKNAKWLWLLIVLIIIGGLVFAFVRGIGPFSRFQFGSSQEEESTPSPFVFESPSPSPLEESPALEVDKREVSIKVLNGSGKTGAAASMKDLLEGKGWKVASIGNASSSDFDQTELRFKVDVKKFEKTLTGDLSDKYSVTTGEDLEGTGSADIEVIIGAK